VAKLTPKQERFIAEYLVDLNATQAAIRAGYSQDTAKEIGYENLTKPHIQCAIAAAMEARSKRTQVTQDRVLLELARLGFSDLTQLGSWNKDGFTVKNSDELTPDQSASVQEIVFNKSKEGNKSLKLKLHDKKGALELIGRHLSMFTDNLNHQGQVNVQFNIPRPPKGPVVLEEDEDEKD
jgi:phage terminase small subunit